jgi:hypothetical protein
MLTALFAPTPGFSEPGPMVTYLMNQPTSLFSFGMLRLDQAMTNFATRNGGYGWSTYDWDANRITLTFITVEAADVDNDSCRDMLNKIRLTAGIDGRNGKPLLGDASVFSGLFAQMGFQKKTDPKELHQELDRIIDVTVSLKKRDTGQLSCEGPLASDRVLFAEKAHESQKAKAKP